MHTVDCQIIVCTMLCRLSKNMAMFVQTKWFEYINYSQKFNATNVYCQCMSGLYTR